MQPENLTQNVYVYGLTWWQVVLIAAVAGAALVLFDRAWERVVVWWEERPDADLVDPPLSGDGSPLGRPADPPPPVGGFVPRDAPSPEARGRMAESPFWWTKSTRKLHKAACPFAEHGEPLRFVVTAEDARLRAELVGMEPAVCCDPLGDKTRAEVTR